MLLVERLFRDKVRRNDEIDMNSNNNNIEGDVLKSSSRVGKVVLRTVK